MECRYKGIIMDETIKKLDSYFGELKAKGSKVPRHNSRKRPHFKAISAASGIEYRKLFTEPYRQRIDLAVKEIGFSCRKGLDERLQWHESFQHNQVLLDKYIEWLKKNGLKLPEDPKRKGKLFFAQLEIEAGLNPNALIIKGRETENSYRMQLIRLIESAILEIGMDVRILPCRPGEAISQITYGDLFTRGSVERKGELEGRSSGCQQLYNTRWALNHFIKSLDLNPTTYVGKELIIDFNTNCGKALNRIKSTGARKKFKTEINWWLSFYHKLIKEPALPEKFHDAFSCVVKKSSLSLAVLAKFITVSDSTLSFWCKGGTTPGESSLKAVFRLESLFKLPAGALVNKIPPGNLKKIFRARDLPEFLRQNPKLTNKIKRYLPNNFCDLPLTKQEEIVTSIQTGILQFDDPFTKRIVSLQALPYRLKKWPEQLRQEFDNFASFKMADRPPLGMKRIGSWRPQTRLKQENDFSFLFGAICLPNDAEDPRLRGLGMPLSQLTLVLLACPLVVDWYIRFRCEIRNQYTEYTIDLLNSFKSMLKPDTGWLRQSPHLASRLRPIRYEQSELVSEGLISKAQTDWDWVCNEAIKYYKQQIDELKLLTSVSRDPFKRIEGIVNLDVPMKAVEQLIREVRNNLPSVHTQPVLYHIGVRDCALISLIFLTGLRRNTIAQLEYTQDNKGHLTIEGDQYILKIPRQLFKKENSPFFGPKHAQKDYVMKLPNVYDLKDVFNEYLNVSRPFLLNTYYPDCKDNPLFVVRKAKYPRMSATRVSRVYSDAISKYLVENKWRNTGLAKVMPTGPHSLRHIRGTTIVKKTGSFQLAADANHTSERTAHRHYARFVTEDRNKRVNEVLFGETD